MTCAQGLLRLLWGGPKLECYGTGQSVHGMSLVQIAFLSFRLAGCFTANAGGGGGRFLPSCTLC